VGSRPGLERCGKSRPLLGFNSPNVQPVQTCYSGYANHFKNSYFLNYSIELVKTKYRLIFSCVPIDLDSTK